jgi:signal transduction histidine kinase
MPIDLAVPGARLPSQDALGLMGMRERAAILGGQVNISSAPGKGTAVAAWIPFPSPERAGAKT